MAGPEAARLVLHPFHGPGLGPLLERIDGVTLVAPEDDAGVTAALAGGADGLVVFRWRDEFAVPGLRWIQALSAGIEQFPLRLLTDRGIVLTSARGAHTPAVAEHAIGLLYTLVREIGRSVRGASERRWEPVPAYELQGRTLAVVGLGSIGEAVARRGVALGMRVIGVKRSPAGYDGAAERVWGPEGILEVCDAAEALVLALPEAPGTDGLIGAPELQALGAGWLVNVGRGSTVDEAALVDALTGGDLRGAGLDVTLSEPLRDDSPLWDLDNVVITPHMAWSTDRLAGRIADLVERNLRALQRGEPMINRVV